MNAILVLIFMGVIFTLLGGGIAIAFSSFSDIAGGMIAIPLIFLVLGLCMLGYVIYYYMSRNTVKTKGTKYKAKIYSYVQNTSYTFNGSFPLNVKARYFDAHGDIREAILPTNFSQGSTAYPIGYTIDIFEYNGKYDYDASSVRNESLSRENELMSNKPVDPEQIKIVAVRCPNCGASFEASKGYSNKCPYCDSALNV